MCCLLPRRHGRARSGELGSILLATLVVTLIVTAALLTATYTTATRLRGTRSEGSGALASAYARAGLEVGARLASQSVTWRSSLGQGSWISSQAIGSGRVSVTASDPGDSRMVADGTGGSASCDTVRLVATGTERGITRSARQDFVPLVHPVMPFVICTPGRIRMTNVRVEGRLRANGPISNLGGATVVGDLTTTIGNLVTPGLDDADSDVFYVSTAMTMPTPDFNWFKTAGKQISVPLLGSFNDLSISPEHNPAGAPSPNGIYWIDAGGGDVTFVNVAVLACLAVLNANKVIIRDPGLLGIGAGPTRYYHHSPDPDRLPALLVQGDIRMSVSGSGTLPLDRGGSMTTVSSTLNGVFYCTGEFLGPQNDGDGGALSFQGAILAANRVELIGDELVLQHDPGLNTNPLAELTTAGLRPVPGSFTAL